MSGSRFGALEKEDFSFMEGKPVGSKNANIFMMHFHFLASQGKNSLGHSVFHTSLRASTML